MNISTIPTDNLYKFIAIFGLAIFISSFFLVKDTDLEKRDKAGSEYVIAKDLMDFNLKRYNESKEVYDYLGDKLQSFKISKETDLDVFLDHRKDFDESCDLMNLRYQEYYDSYRDLLMKQFNNKFYEDLIKFNKSRSSNLIILGSILIVIGFLLWYYKHQRYIDAQKAAEGNKFLELLNHVSENKIKNNNKVDLDEDKIN
ncbi:hypothetical protein [Algibacter aquimarinus]|uniref:Uncharacterized protein n=1 Tax=Algibacter aquimarinus TaxID=1136748 RepID=A0ABP9HGG3_9FLAO